MRPGAFHERNDHFVFVVGGKIVPADLPGLCARACRALRTSDAPVIVCDAAAVLEPDAVAVEALARLQLAARGAGRRLVLRDAPPALTALLAFAGLVEAVPVLACSDVDARGEPEEGEQARRVEEEVGPRDAPAGDLEDV